MACDGVKIFSRGGEGRRGTVGGEYLLRLCLLVFCFFFLSSFLYIFILYISTTVEDRSILSHHVG
ncbi:hypothetical protein EJ05DRAFT_370784 [Pseudovirgaria hyperparasitica]|uniref:Uncharacterized protein n=1 Tax=Pseudovirgaria hyperparasitica TaxID=470096 RepID=A0A6A6W4S7_9PEZI|nr:uncharacterized protein EJ05DRAFT_370784 [Pseudovirgaria hyperparasitica]KAF2757882.1 hypothetical protein EJ05DRAFT_370784 [Pseudovirgaria hyperparasitica]